MRILTIFLQVLILGIFSAVLFGLIFDQFTVRNSPEYFTVGHPIRPDWLPDPALYPTRVALFWGIAATWWVGAGLGFVHGLILLIFDRRVTFGGLVRRHMFLLALMGLVATTTFFLAPHLGEPEQVIPWWMLRQLEPDQIAPFAQNAITHTVAYLGAAVGALILFAYAIWHGRRDR